MDILNKKRIREDFSQAASTYDSAAVVQHEICDRTLARLQMLKLYPKIILDIGTGTGRSVRGLQNIYPNSQIIASDFALPMLQQQQHHHACVCCDTGNLPIKTSSIDLIFSTSTFQWCEDLQHVFKECFRVLKVGGTLVFTTFGPDTLKELRSSWAKVDQHEHVHTFIDMHHIGDFLLAAQYMDPVVDCELITIEYQKLRHLLNDLKATGSREKFNQSQQGKRHGLTGKNMYQLLKNSYERFRQKNGLLPASYEVIYGYGRKPAPTKISKSEVKIPIDKIR